ncbi:hypothetical protein WN944_001883 [Citrus x changshan-huyou]|uniref:Uncharacterized protein n=1 Tax=Citrus x changshan-huyou TaxID=2935761 RepID=A0AAP0QRN0_9ROSI
MHIRIKMNQKLLRQISSPWKLGVRLTDFVLLLVTYRKTRKTLLVGKQTDFVLSQRAPCKKGKSQKAS